MLVNTHLLKGALATLIIMVSILFNNNQASAQTWSLEQCIDTALVHNKRLSMANDDVLIAQEKNKEAKTSLMPKISLNGDYKYYIDLPYQIMPASVFGGPDGTFKEIQFGVPHNISANAQLSLPLYNPQINGGIKNTQISMEIRQLQFQKTKEEVLWEVSNLYYNAQILTNLIPLLESNMGNLQKLHDNTVLLHQQKLALPTDVNRVKLQLEQLKIQKEKANSNYQQILNALKITMGLPLEKEIEVESEVVYKDQTEYDQQSTIDFRLATAQNHFVSSELNNLKQSRLPSVSAVGMYGTNGFGYTGKPNDFLDFYRVGFVGVQVAYPIFSGTTTQKRIAQKRIELQKSQTQINLIDAQNEMEIENAINKKNTAESEVNMNRSQIDLAESIYQDMALQHREGLAKLTDVLLADNELQEAQQHYLSAMVEYLKADLELKKATGNILNQN